MHPSTAFTCANLVTNAAALIAISDFTDLAAFSAGSTIAASTNLVANATTLLANVAILPAISNNTYLPFFSPRAIIAASDTSTGLDTAMTGCTAFFFPNPTHSAIDCQADDLREKSGVQGMPHWFSY
jgi:hypothetical protein